MPLSGVREHKNTHASGGSDAIDSPLDLTAIPSLPSTKLSEARLKSEVWLSPLVFHPETATRGLQSYMPTLDFDADSAERIEASFASREAWSTAVTLKVDIYWMAAATTGNVVWKSTLSSIKVGQAVAVGSEASVTDAPDGSTQRVVKSTITLPAITKTDIVNFAVRIERDAANGSDTMTGDAKIYLVVVRE